MKSEALVLPVSEWRVEVEGVVSPTNESHRLPVSEDRLQAEQADVAAGMQR